MLNYWIQLTPNVELHLLQLQNPLITASPELQIWREKSLFEASVHQYINIIKSGTQTRLRLNFFVCVSGVAPVSVKAGTLPDEKTDHRRKK